MLAGNVLLAVDDTLPGEFFVMLNDIVKGSDCYGHIDDRLGADPLYRCTADMLNVDYIITQNIPDLRADIPALDIPGFAVGFQDDCIFF